MPKEMCVIDAKGVLSDVRKPGWLEEPQALSRPPKDLQVQIDWEIFSESTYCFYYNFSEDGSGARFVKPINVESK